MGAFLEKSSGDSLRVAYFAGTLRPDQDGVTRVLYRWAEALQAAGIEHLFFSPIIPPMGEQVAPMVRVPSVMLPLYSEYRFALPGFKHFEEKLLAFDPDLLHINTPCSLGFAALQFARKYGIPAVATYHTNFTHLADYYRMQPLKPLGWRYLRNLYNRCAKVFVPSQPMLDELWGHGLNTLSLLPHGVDAELFNPGLRSQQWRDQFGLDTKKILLYAGRLAWEKDLDVLASAYGIITTRRNDTRLVFAGTGPIQQELRRMLPDALFLGHLSSKELASAYASSDVFVFPSTIESFGNVTMEAMASGLPPVCARMGGSAYIIRDGMTGVLTDPRDPRDLASQVELLLDNPELRTAIALNARRYACGQGWGPIIAGMFRSYREIIADAAVNAIKSEARNIIEAPAVLSPAPLASVTETLTSVHTSAFS